MKVDVTSMFFNSSIEGKTATAAWGTSIGQNASKSCRIETGKDGVIDFIVGMTYKSTTNFESLDISKGSSNRELLMLSSFDKIYINDQKLEDAKYHIILVKELSDSHYGRLIVSYAPYITFEGYSNEETIELMQNALGCSAEGCWFVYDISIKNQDELHFSAVVVNPEHSMVYYGTSRERSLEWNAMIGRNEDEYEIPNEKQVIYYGCPGSGKSHKVKEIVNSINSDYVFRTTFHPDTDYSAFVGCYKPLGTTPKKPSYTIEELITILVEIKNSGTSYPVHKFAVEYYFALEGLSRADKESIITAADFTTNYVTEMDKAIAAGRYVKRDEKDSNIVYRFLPQVFTNAYVQAWKNPEKPTYLIIEEINRGNCAQIFGDLFQLLDRDKVTGKSEYPIKADKDLVAYIEKELGAGHEGIKNGELCLPSNLIIYATMNTSDQSLFPMDSAFKRRWDWEYVPINYDKNIDSGKFIIKLDDDTKYLWVDFLEKVNDKIYDATNSEDKQMGNFFIKKSVDAKEFINKVMFYLWNEVCKEEYGTQRNFFRKGKDGKTEFKFTELFGANQTTILNEFMTSLGVEPTNKPNPEEPAAE
ncbi:MAG: AAA family ATPase [Alistipes sp.]|nr:AAA family ATPase [Alistipes sp.]